jgi:hypothetical protein
MDCIGKTSGNQKKRIDEIAEQAAQQKKPKQLQ